MKTRRVVQLSLVLLTVGAVAFLGLRGGPKFAQPAACVQAYYDAAKAGNGDGFLQCFAAPLRSQLEQRFDNSRKLADYLATFTGDLKGWAQPSDEVIDGARAHLEIDERRAGKRLRVRYELANQQGSWLIVAIGNPTELPEHVPYDTHVSKTPGGP